MKAALQDVTLKALGAAAKIISLRRHVIFCLHSVVPDDMPEDLAGSISVRAKFIELIASSLRSQGAALVSVADLLKSVEERSRPCIALTFDDGYRDNYEILFPIIKRIDLPVAIFPVTGMIDRKTPMWWHALEKAIARANHIEWVSGRLDVSDKANKWRAYRELDRAFRRFDAAGQRQLTEELAFSNKEFQFSDAYDAALDWQMIKEMSSTGLVEFGCHSIDHPLFSGLSASEVERQVIGSRERLVSATGLRARYFAYPFGQSHEVGRLAPGIVRRAGFDAGLTTEAAVLDTSSLRTPETIPRIMLASKAQHPLIVDAYASGLPSGLRRMRAPVWGGLNNSRREGSHERR